MSEIAAAEQVRDLKFGDPPRPNTVTISTDKAWEINVALERLAALLEAPATDPAKALAWDCLGGLVRDNIEGIQRHGMNFERPFAEHIQRYMTQLLTDCAEVTGPKS